MSGLKVLDGGVKHGDAIGLVGIVGEEHVDVFSWDDGRIQKRLMNEVTHGRCVRCCCLPIGDVTELIIIFEGIELGEEELAVTGRAVPCGEVRAWATRCLR